MKTIPLLFFHNKVVQNVWAIYDQGEPWLLYNTSDNKYWDVPSTISIPNSLYQVQHICRLGKTGCKENQFYSLPFGQAVASSPQTVFD